MDQRDELTWVALELSRLGEQKVQEGTLEPELRKELGVNEDWPVFVPAKVYSKNGKTFTVHVMEGYAFVATGLDEVRYFRLERSRWVQKIMTTEGPKGLRILSAVSNLKIKNLRQVLIQEIASDITPGMNVQIIGGTYSKMEGIVLDIIEDDAIVNFTMRSLEVIARIPKVFLDTKEQP